ncbi:MAG TPA: TlpA disulfide reductase family protein [Blastocatellia bacterium]|nr:TlpA disulfide reductase family protein [Blastocatellia bacterium]
MIIQSWKTNLAIALLTATGAILSNCSTDEQYAETRTAAAIIGKASRLAGSQAALPAAPSIGHPAPDFQLKKIDGGWVSLADLRGKPAVIVFWSAWCSSCKEEAPRINALADKYERKGVRVLGIDIKDSAARTESGVREFGIRYTVARDPDASVARAYQVRGTPTIVFLDREGVVRYFANELPADYAQRLDGLLAGTF